MALTQSQIEELRASPVPKTGNRVGIAIELSASTQAFVAAAIGFTQPYLSDMVRARYQSVSLDNARKVANHFGCQIEDLFPDRDLPSDRRPSCSRNARRGAMTVRRAEGRL